MPNRRTLSRRRFLAGAGGLSLAGALAACGNDDGAPDPTATPQDTAGPSPTATPTSAPTTTPTAAATESPGNGPPLEVMVGQMLLLGFRGTELDDANPIVEDLTERHIGGVVLFDYDVELDEPGRNITSSEQLIGLTESLQRAASHKPLIIAADQEGGLVRRLGPQNGFAETPSAAEVGATGNPDYATAVARETAGRLAQHGINLNFAPVVDVNTNPDNPVIGALDRSFSSDPAVVTEMAIATVQGHHEQGVLTTLKHFPGHGSSTADSHEGFVDVTATWDELELEPYHAIVDAGLADTVMSAHVFNANLDPEYPATLSRAVITGILRDSIGFDGVAITDDLQMGAIADQFGFEDAVRYSIEAGNDILAIANNLTFDPGIGARAHDIVMDLVESGDISVDRIRQSYDRITRLKRRFAR